MDNTKTTQYIQEKERLVIDRVVIYIRRLEGCLAGLVGRAHASRLQGHETEPHVCCRVYLKLTN